MNRIKIAVHNLIVVISVIFHKMIHTTDRRRWSQSISLLADWDLRTREMAGFIPKGSRVLEFGAGRMALQDLLPPDCTYTPSDLVSRSPNTLVYDINSDQAITFPQCDVVFAGGVLEYLIDLPYFVSRIRGICQTVVCSYAPRDQKSILIRRSNGWVNDFSTTQIEQIFMKNGFSCDRKMPWRDQWLFRFKKNG